jgi:putative transposase
VTAPRCYLPGRTYMISRRVAQRLLRLRPTSARPALDVIRWVFVYCVAWAAKLYAIDLHALIVLGNHWHAVVTETGGDTRLADFLHRVHMFVSKLLNVEQGEGETLWAARAPSAVHLPTRAEVLDKLVYVIVNAVAANLVDAPEDWPGLHTTARDVGARVLVARRPTWFFRQPRPRSEEADDEAPLVTPDEARIEITKPPAFADLSDEEFRRLLQGAVDARLAELRAARTRPPLGAEAILAQDPRSRPGPSLPDRGVSPRVACRDKWRRIELLTTLKEFFVSYRAAWEQWRAARTEEARRGVVFPLGTYWMRVKYGVTCEPHPGACASEAGDFARLGSAPSLAGLGVVAVASSLPREVGPAPP